MVSSSAKRSKVARTERGSIATAEMRVCATRSGTTWAAAAKAPRASPSRSVRVSTRLPSMPEKSSGAPRPGPPPARPGRAGARSPPRSDRARRRPRRRPRPPPRPPACRPRGPGSSARIGCGGTRMSGIRRFTGIGARCATSLPVTTSRTRGARARRLHVEAGDAGVGVRGAEQGHVQAAGRRHVVHVGALADQEAMVLAPLERAADPAVALGLAHPRNRETAPTKAAGCSYGSMCPASGTISTAAPGISRPQRSA